MIRQVQYPSYSMTPLDRVSWGAIWSGTFASMASMACLSLLGVGIGLAAAPAGGGAAAPGTIGTAGAVWLWVCGIVSFYFGGWVTGHLTHSSSELDNGIHAFVSWSVATVGLLFLVAVTAAGSAAEGSLGPVLGISRAGFAMVSPIQGAGAAFFGFVMLITEAIASVYGGRTGTRLYKPVGITGTSAQYREKEISSVR